MKIQTDQSSILVPWDFSELSAHGLMSAVNLVDNPANIRVVHVAPWPTYADYGMAWGDFSETQTISDATKAFRERWQGNEKIAELPFEVLLGDPGTQICDYARENDSTLIVIPSHGRTGIGRLVMGSVAERVVRYAPCPVLVLRAESIENPPVNEMPESSAETV